MMDLHLLADKPRRIIGLAVNNGVDHASRGYKGAAAVNLATKMLDELGDELPFCRKRSILEMLNWRVQGNALIEP